ncbi:MAG TPA: hypothetical protein VMR52_12085 [Dehalococcoidia bacterium]|nr:hypothetical protein [Dehalococcoidia bacterium]
MLRRSFTPGIIAAVAALLVGGFAVATESPLTGSPGPAPAQETDTQGTTQNDTPFDEHPGQGAEHCQAATAHALETLMAELEAGEDVQASIDEIKACGTGADDGDEADDAGPPEGVNPSGPPDWLPGPPPWAGTEDGAEIDTEGDDAGPPEGVTTGGPPDGVPGPPPHAGTGDDVDSDGEDGDTGPPEGVNQDSPPDWVPGPPPHAGTGDDVDSDGEDGDTGPPEGATTGGPPDWIPGPPPGAGEEEEVAQP